MNKLLVLLLLLMFQVTCWSLDLKDFLTKEPCEECARMDYLQAICDEKKEPDPVLALIRSKTEHFTPTDEKSFAADFNDLPARWIATQANMSVSYYQEKHPGIRFLKRYELSSFYDLCFNAWLDKARVLYNSQTGSVVLLLIFRDPIVETDYLDPGNGNQFIVRSHGIRIINPATLNYKFELWMDDPKAQYFKKLK